MRVDLDGCVGTGYRTKLTTDTSRRIVNLGVKLTALGNLLRHRKDLLRTGLYAKLTAFAVIFINCNSGHIINSFWIDRSLPGFRFQFPRLQHKTLQGKNGTVDLLGLYFFKHFGLGAYELHRKS